MVDAVEVCDDVGDVEAVVVRDVVADDDAEVVADVDWEVVADELAELDAVVDTVEVPVLVTVVIWQPRSSLLTYLAMALLSRSMVSSQFPFTTMCPSLP